MADTQPYNENAEMAVLAVCLLEPSSIRLIDLHADEFFLSKNKRIYNLMKELDKGDKDIDIVSLSENKDDSVYISKLITQNVSSYNIETYAEIVRDCSNRRRAIQTAGHMATQAYNMKEPFVTGEYVTSIMEIDRGKMDDSTIKDGIRLFDDWQEKRIELNHSGQMDKFPKTHIQGLDNVLIMLEPKQVTILAGEPGVGKTMLSQQIIEANTQTGRIVFSLEMNIERLVARMISAKSGVPVSAMRMGLPGDDGTLLQRIRASYKAFEDQKIFLRCKPRMTVENMYSEIAKIRAQGNEIGLVVIDYFGLIDENSPSASPNEKDDIKSQKVQRMTRELDVHTILIDTYNKNQFGSKHGSMGGIYGSVRKVYDVDNAITLTLGERTVGGVQIFADIVKSRDAEGSIGRIGMLRENGKPVIREMTAAELSMATDEDDTKNKWK